MLIHWIIQSLIAWLLDMVVAVLSILSSAFNNAMALKGEDTLDLFFRLFLPNKTGSGSPVTFLTGVGMLILYIIFLFQVFKSYFAPLGVKSEHPIRLLLKTLIFMVLVVEAPNICYMFFNVGTAPYNFFLNEAQWEGGSTPQDLAGWASGLNKSMVSSVGSAVPGNIDGVSKSVLGLVEDVLCIVMLFSILINFVKLIIEVAERYVILGVLSIFSPLCIATGVSDATSSILKKWIQAMISQVILMCMSVFFLSSFQVAAGKITTTGDIAGEHGIFIGMVLLLAWLRTGQRIDSHMGTLGLGALQAGGGLYGDMFAGAALAHSAGKAIGSGASIGMNARNAMKSGGVKSASQALKGAFAFHAAQNGGALGGAIAGNMLSKADAGTRAAFNHAVNNSSIKGLSRQRVGEAERHASQNNPKAAEAMSSVENKVGKMKEGWSIDPNTGMYRGSYIAPDGQEVGLQIDKEGNISAAAVNGNSISDDNKLSEANEMDVKSLAANNDLAAETAANEGMAAGYIDENGNFQEIPEGGKIEDGIAYDADGNELGEAAYQAPAAQEPSTYIDENGTVQAIPEGGYVQDGVAYDANGDELGAAGSYMYDDGNGHTVEAPAGSSIDTETGMVMSADGEALGAAVVQGEDGSFQSLAPMQYEDKDGNMQAAPVGSTIDTEGNMIAPDGTNLGAAMVVGEDGTMQSLASASGGIQYDDGNGNIVSAPTGSTIDSNGNVIAPGGKNLGAAMVSGKDGSLQSLAGSNGGIQYQGADGKAISAPAGSTFDAKTGMVKDSSGKTLGAAMVSNSSGTGMQAVAPSSGGLQYQGTNGNAISAPAGSTFDAKTGMVKDSSGNVLGAAMVSNASGTGMQTVSSSSGGLRYQNSDGNTISAPAGSTFDARTGTVKDSSGNTLGVAMVSNSSGTGIQSVGAGGMKYEDSNGKVRTAPSGSTFDSKTGMVKDSSGNTLGAASAGKGGAFASSYAASKGAPVSMSADTSNIPKGSQFLDAGGNFRVPPGSTMKTDSNGITHLSTKDGSETVSFAQKVGGTRELANSTTAKVGGVACSMSYSGSPNNTNLSPAIKENLDRGSIRASSAPVSSSSISSNPNAMYLIKDQSGNGQYGGYRQATAQEVSQARASGKADTGLRAAEGRYTSSVGGERHGTVQLKTNGQVQETRTVTSMKSAGYTSAQRGNGTQTFINKDSGKAVMVLDASKYNVSGHGVSTRTVDGKSVYQVEGQYNKKTGRATYSSVRISEKKPTYSGGNITENPASKKSNGNNRWNNGGGTKQPHEAGLAKKDVRGQKPVKNR